MPHVMQLQQQLDAAAGRQRRGARAQRAPGGRGERPEGRPGDGRGEGARRARHGQARRDPGAGQRRATLSGRRSTPLLDAARAAAGAGLHAVGQPGHLAGDRGLRAGAGDGGVQHARQPAGLAAGHRQLAAVCAAVLRTAGCTARPALQLFFVVVALLGLVAVAARHRRRRRAAARAPAVARAALAGAGRHAARPGRCWACCCSASPTATCPGWDALPTVGSLAGQWLLGRK